jgi:hypothetical protein
VPPTVVDQIGVDDLILLGARLSFGSEVDSAMLEQIIARLVMMPAGDRHADRAVSDRIVARYTWMWRSGWLPLDVLHAVRRQLSAKAARLAAELILDDQSLRAADRPAEWDDQLAAVQATTNGRFVATVSGVERWRRAEKATLGDALTVALQVLGAVLHLPAIPPMAVPPTDWSRFAGVPRQRASSGAVDPKLVEKVRALLAKAEGTDFPAEAEAFTSKAQELMSRHAIDSAMLGADRPGDLGGDVRSRRIHIDDPYAAEKAQLLGAVAMNNTGRVVWDQQFGWATIVGFPIDLDLAELLFTSLLIQLTRAMGDAGRSGGRAKSASFRRAFVLSYADRIRERLTEAQHHAQDEAVQQYGTSLVPVLAARTDAVDQITQQLFPRLRESRIRRVDSQGWYAGRLAADMATLQAGSGVIQR